eukprot:UN01998
MALILTFVTALILYTYSTLASCDCCHTWHNITATKGHWTVIISSVYEGSHFWNKTTCTQYPETPHVQFNLSSNNTRMFGMELTFDDTFDIIYSVTIILTASEGEEPMKIPIPKHPFNLQSSRKLLIASTGCVFVVSAAGVALSDIRANVYNGATCMWSRVAGVGENYLVDYAYSRTPPPK